MTAWSDGGQIITAAAAFHEGNCPVLLNGASVVMVLPLSAVELAGTLTDRLGGDRQ